MSDDAYLWDRSGEVDPRVAELERQLGALDDREAVAHWIDEFGEFDGLAASDDSHGSHRTDVDGDAVVVELPALHADRVRGPELEPASGPGWIWMTAAAATLLLLSAVGLVRRARSSSTTSTVRARVAAGEGSPARARVELTARGGADAEARGTLASLRPAHAALARCALRVDTRVEATVDPTGAVQSNGGDTVRACLEAALPSPRGPRASTIVIVLEPLNAEAQP